ncbi:hypothetical protein PR048_004792 [Dryococelus australis]|uniref:Uncharacterized protein n=1 Tax=Dryococelus australis TaxID=614101 RepID=A0ABQ9I6E5_9NEOP|nr:hypothetical protein PR048_004792 [Dryococelus australis]
MYSQIFCEKFNLRFFVPKKDQCIHIVNETHLKETKQSRERKVVDKPKTNVVLAVFNLQTVQLCPNGQLGIFNLTVYYLKTNQVECYVWQERETQRGVNEIGFIILLYLESTKTDATHETDVIFYSDNCAGKQKNHFMIAVCMYTMMKYAWIRNIINKFLITGRSQNYWGGGHSVIETSFKP